ncbi:hypothetical protein [Halosimplex salinum]|uniref:hypothetical protein n=1 Tax=Halosimplex salinum TaxID=1710538 RepID=UPI000F4A6AC3|nr:hypothetical protein [Halosimplex salinum]
MNRRTFLAAIGAAGISGCAGFGGSATDTASPASTESDSTGRTEQATETPSADPTPWSATDTAASDGVSPSGDGRFVDLETADRTYALTPMRYRTPDEGEITAGFGSTATAERPVTLSATLENANDFENTFRIEWTPPFGRLSSRVPEPFHDGDRIRDATYRTGLVLAPTANHDLVDEPPELERDDDGLWRATDVDQWLPERVRLAPGETVEGEYAVVGHPDGAGEGRPPGIYEFRGRADSTLRIAVWETERPGPGGTSRFERQTLPAISDELSTAWFHDADETASTYLHPDRERDSLPAQVTFTFVNKSRSATECGHWNLYKLAGDQWFHVGPYMHTADCRSLAPGQTKSWTLNAYGTEALPAIGHGDGASFGFLGGGAYAVVVGYGAQADQSAALVELVGDDVSIEPTDDVTSERTGATVTVTSPRRERTETTSPATLTLTSADDADRTLVPEQVMQRRYRGLRNTVAFLTDDVETVRLETSERVAERVVGHDTDRQRVRIRDHATYEASIERASE